MLRIGKDSNLTPQKVLNKAVAFFGPSGRGLNVVSEDDCCARFEGGGGYVSVQVADHKEHNGSQVTVSGREWEYQIKQFMGEI